MKLEKKDIAEAFGMYYAGEEESEDGHFCHVFMFKSSLTAKVSIGAWHSVEDAWEESSNEFLKPLEKILFDNL